MSLCRIVKKRVGKANLLSILLATACALSMSNANAFSGGITGQSGKLGATVNCNSAGCHSGSNINSSLTFDGQTTVSPGSTNDLALILNFTSGIISNPATGINIAVSSGGGSLIAGPTTRLLSSELTHNSPQPVSGNTYTWDFSWTAPSTASTITLFACSETVNQNGTTSGDDGQAACIQQQINVEEQQTNSAPTADAGSNQTITLGEVASFDGSASSDPDGDTLTYSWQITSAPSGSIVQLDDAQSAQPSFTPDVAGAYVLALTVNDGELSSAQDSVALTVNEADSTPENQEPIADSNPLATIDVPDPVSDNVAISVKNDFNGDLQGDALLRNDATNEWSIYQFANGDVAESFIKEGMSVVTSWQFNGSGDFNGDGTTDVIIRNSISASWYIYNLSGNSFVSRGTADLPDAKTEAVQAVADFNNDGKADVLIRSEVTGAWTMVLMDNRTALEQLNPPMSKVLSWNIVDARDFDGNGSKDILIRNTASGAWYIYLYENTDIISRGYITELSDDLQDEIQGAADFNGDGKVDILLRNSESRQWSIAYMNGRTPYGTGGVTFTTSEFWDFLEANDFDGDGIADLAIRNNQSGQVYIYLMGSNGVVESESYSSVDIPLSLSIR